jgi:4-diphosphocytidyl-2-C-methyl-D-erythritol kinase
MRAAQLLADAVQRGRRPAGVDIAIEKHIPMGGGLGGGSSDAATTLMALSIISGKLGMTRSELMDLGLQLGADVPFFLLGQNAFVEGIGEQLTAVPTLPCLVRGDSPRYFAVPTPRVFGAAELTRNTKVVKIADFSEAPWASEKRLASSSG